MSRAIRPSLRVWNRAFGLPGAVAAMPRQDGAYSGF